MSNTSTERAPDPLERLLDLVLDTRYEDLPVEAIDAGKIFFLDTVGVACAGRMAPKLGELVLAAKSWGAGAQGAAALWNTGQRAPAPVAAMVNGYQCHALEYDCVYEPGVILPTPPLFAALLTKAEEMAAQGRAPTGQDLLHAFIVGLEVSCTLASASRSEMFFFRPATTGVFSALAAINCLDPLPREQLRQAFGIGYSQVCGSMQAHEEGSMMLAMQMGFAARNAVLAHDMARVGITAPVQVLGGRFGFFHNYERGGDIADALSRIGAPWKVTQLSHKPFPSGRVTHGVIHTLRGLRQQLDLDAGNALQRVRAIHVELPPLGMRLVGRPMVERPTANYARLCVPFVAAAELLFSGVDPTSFNPERLNDEAVLALARRVSTAEKPHPNPNAFYPQTLRLELDDGQCIEREIPYAWGHPNMPLNAAEREDKFRLCWRLTRASDASSEAAMEQALDWLRNLDQASDSSSLLELLR